MLTNNASVRVIHEESARDFGTFRTRGGGAKEGENALIRPGGMAPPVAMAGTWAYGEVTAARLLIHGVDSGVIQEVFNLHGERFSVIDQPLDAKGRAGFHKPVTYSGLLNTSTPPEIDADGNEPQTLELTFTIDSVV